MPNDPAKDFLWLESAYDLLWPIVTTKWYIPLRKGSPSLLHSLVVNIGHNKSYVAHTNTHNHTQTHTNTYTYNMIYIWGHYISIYRVSAN